MSKLYDFVDVIENHSKYSPTDIVKICKRKKNPKRDFLFVNSLQGKHLHVDPAKCFAIYDELVKQIVTKIDADEKVVVIGFCETATAIGHYIASSLINCVYYMQTTRESKLINANSILDFKEEHSHATEQMLYGDVENLKNCDRIVFVDDEISTGKTILNFIAAIESLGIYKKYGVASLLNWQDDEWSEKFSSMNIDTYCILRGKLKDLEAKVKVKNYKEAMGGKNILKPAQIIVKSSVSDFYKERVGSKPHSLWYMSKTVYSEIIGSIEKPKAEEKVLVIGTEEFMFTPMVFGKMLEENLNVNVQFHATTRSPIVASNEEAYAIKTSYLLTSCYDRNRNTYIYNLERYDKVYIITDVVPTEEFVNDITAALVSIGCDVKNVFIITLKG